MNTYKIVRNFALYVSLFMGLVLAGMGIANAHPGGDFAITTTSGYATSSGVAIVGGPGPGTASASGFSYSGSAVLQGTSLAIDVAPPIVGSTHTHFGSAGSAAGSGVAVSETGNGFAVGSFYNEAYSGGLVILP